MHLTTPFGDARLTEHVPSGPPDTPSGLYRATALLLHGAGTDTSARVLVELAAALAAGGILAVRVDQPYTQTSVRRPPAPAPQLDAVVRAVAAVYADRHPTLPLLFAGRSSGSRVACRVAVEVGATAIVALGFPLVPPRRRTPVSRAPELAAAGVPVLVLQGTRDEFGTPADIEALGLPHVTVHAVTDDHSLARRVPEVVRVSADWLLARES